MNFLANFPVELFESYFEHKSSNLNTHNIRFDSDGNVKEITDFRNNTLYKQIALNLNKGFAHDFDLGFSVFKSFAEKHCPTLLTEPTGHKEIESIYKSASKSNIAKQARGKKGIKEDLILLNSTQILESENEEVEWLVEDFINKDGIVALCADAGIGKTMLALELCACIVSGKKFLGKYNVKQGTVLYINQEMPFYSVKSRLEKFGLSKNAPFYTFKIRGFTIEEYECELFELIKEINPALIVFDSLSGIHSKNENSSQEMALVMDFFIRLSDLGIAVLLPHHITKGEGNYRGSSAIKAKVDLMLMLEKVKDTEADYRIKYEKVRIDKFFKDKKLRLISKEDSLQFVELHPDPVDMTPQKPETKQKRTSRTEAKDFILKKLMPSALSGKPISKKEILEACIKEQLNERQVENTLQELVRSSEIYSPKKGLYALPEGSGS